MCQQAAQPGSAFQGGFFSFVSFVFKIELLIQETRDINEAVKNNPDKFPEGYVLELTKDDWDFLKSKFSTIDKRKKVESSNVVENFDHLEKLKYSPYLPKAFTEKGLYMLATILKSNIATQTTLAIIETFARIRELSKNIKDLSEIKDDSKKNRMLKKSGQIIAEILDDNMKVTDTETSIEINPAYRI
ncbi:MAG: ORF6N domain-containing protein [Ignavibacteriales bacterium]|nr:ORF6N domain-containing protein [Ignavibacteriales bacterium]